MIPASYYYYFIKMFGLSLCTVLGVLAMRTKNIHRESISHLIFFFIAPVVFFTSAINIKLHLETFYIMFAIICMSTLISFIASYISSFFVSQNEQNFIAFAASTSNAGYFLMSVASDTDIISSINKYIICVIAISLFEHTIGKYICLKNHLSVRSIVKDFFKSPALIAFILGIFLNLSQISLPSLFDEFIYHTRNSFAFLGMLLIGLNLGTIEKLSQELIVKKKYFFIIIVTCKIVIQPLIYGMFLYFSEIYELTTDPDYIKSLIVMMFAPISSSILLYAKYLKIRADITYSSIATSMILSMIIVPFVVSKYLI